MWDQRYSESGFAFGTKPNDFLVESTPLLKPGGRILCLAEGEGRNGVYLAQLGFAVECVDSSAVGLEKAQKLAAEKSVAIRTTIADLSDYTIPEDYYDGIISIFCHLPPEVQKAVHAQIYPGLKQAGVFILEGYSKNQLERDTGGPKKLEMLMDLETVTDELEQLTIQHSIETVRTIHEGKYHDGPGSVIQLIGIKK